MSVDGLTVRNSTFSNTKSEGAALMGPWDGIDLEPNAPSHVFKNILIENCLFFGNANKGVDVHLYRLNSTSEPVSIRLVNNRIYDSEFSLVVATDLAPNNYRGLVEVDGLITDRCSMNRAAVAPNAAKDTFKVSRVILCQGGLE